MSDEDLDQRGPQAGVKAWRHVIAEGRGKEQKYLATAPCCDVCGKLVATYGRTRHFLCESTGVVGHACSCPGGCSDTRIGNGSVPCDPACVPCRRRHGDPLKSNRSRLRGG